MSVEECLSHDLNDGLIVVICTVCIHAEELGKLGGSDDDGRGVGEAVHHRVGEEVHHYTQPEHPQKKLDRTHHQGEQNGVGDVALRSR
jgi:hypothetical protein